MDRKPLTKSAERLWGALKFVVDMGMSSPQLAEVYEAARREADRRGSYRIGARHFEDVIDRMVEGSE
jgi:hypothetical protein